MTRLKYPQEMIDKARRLWEGGLPANEVAKAIGINRRETIFNWRKKYGWSREEDTRCALTSTAELLRKYWYQALEYTIEALKTSEFKSAEGAIQALDTATNALSKLDTILRAEEPHLPSDNVRSMLNL